MLLPILSFNAVNIDSFVVTPALLMYVAASGSNTPVLFAFSKDYNKAFKNTFKHLFFGKPLEETKISTIANIRTANIRDVNMKRMNLSSTQVWLMLLPILSFNAVNIDSFVVTPALLMYVAASGSNTPVLFAFSKDYNKAFKNTFKHLFCGKPLEETKISTIGNIRAANTRDVNMKRMNLSSVVEPVKN
uniref:Uncharacterized protein n=1 Tax=Meloidogyne floridensis TaxID=298350 RepID=A0A915PAT8_9BILA